MSGNDRTGFITLVLLSSFRFFNLNSNRKIIVLIQSHVIFQKRIIFQICLNIGFNFFNWSTYFLLINSQRDDICFHKSWTLPPPTWKLCFLDLLLLPTYLYVEFFSSEFHLV